MGIPAKQLEVERVVNLIRAFGWELQEQKFGETAITITVTKKLSPEMRGASPGTSPG